jgi:chromosome segregation ATPase
MEPRKEVYVPKDVFKEREITKKIMETNKDNKDNKEEQVSTYDEFMTFCFELGDIRSSAAKEAWNEWIEPKLKELQDKFKNLEEENKDWEKIIQEHQNIIRKQRTEKEQLRTQLETLTKQNEEMKGNSVHPEIARFINYTLSNISKGEKSEIKRYLLGFGAIHILFDKSTYTLTITKNTSKVTLD